MNGFTLLTLGLGGLLGGAVALLIWLLKPATPALGPALARMAPGTATAPAEPHRLAALAGKVTGWFIPAEADLLVLGRDRKTHRLGLALAAGFGLAAPFALTIGLATVGVSLPYALPSLAGPVMAVVLMLMLVRDVKGRAGKARRHYSKGVAIYLNLVAANVANGFGPVECMERAAEICHGPVFEMIRTTLNRARLGHQQPWEQLRLLGERLQVPALSDVGDIMRASGTQSADVYDTLREARSSLRKQIRFANLAAAGTGSTKLGSIGALLLVVVLILATYPFITRLGMF